jgi:DNA-binding MarR family transcriptional regulator
MMNDSPKLKSPAYQLWLATNAWQRLLRKALHPLNLTHVQFMILASTDLLSDNRCQCVTQADIVRFAALDENMTSQVVRNMVKAGLIERSAHPTDRRARELKLTARGSELAASALVEVRKVSAEFFSPLGSRGEELANMLRLLVPDQGTAESSGALKRYDD